LATQQAKYLFRKRGVYYFERRVPAELSAHYPSPKIVKSLKTKNLNRANKLARQLADKLDDHWASLRGDLFSSMVAGHQTFIVASPAKKSTMTIQDALSEYLRHKGQGKGNRFRRYAERSVGYLVEFAGSKSLTDYSRADANALRDALIDRGLVASSIKRNFEVVRSVFNVAVREAGLEVPNPFSGVILSSARQGAQRSPIPIDDIRKVQQLCYQKDDDMRWLIALLSDTGMRLAEAAGLAKEDVFLDSEIPYVRLCERPWRPLKTRSSERDVPLVGAALWAVRRACEAHSGAYLFPRYCSESRCKSDYASNALNKWMRSKVTSGGVIHGLRHSFRDRLRGKECPSDVIDQLGGWQTVGVGQNYGFGYSLAVKYKWILKISLQSFRTPLKSESQ
jgi:integrase